MIENLEIEGTNGPIPAMSWGSPENCTAAVLLIHGLGAHKQWMESLGSRLGDKGIFALAYDQAGFGGRRDQEFVSRLQWLGDARTAFEHLRSLVPGRPVFLLGNSMGGVVAFCACPAINPDGLVLTSPGFDSYPGLFPLSFKVSTLLKGLFEPSAAIRLPYGLELVTASESIQETMANDPETRFQPMAKMLRELLLLTLSVSGTCKEITVPVLLATAGKDRIVNNEVTEGIYDKLNSPRKKHVQFPDAYHDLMFDPAIDDVAQSIAAWVAECIPVEA